jgi:hypothetical protein
MPQLYRLQFIDSDVADSDLAAISSLGSLSSLDLRGTKVTDAGLAHLAHTNVTILHLPASITDAGLAYLERMPTLAALDISLTQVSATGIAHQVRASQSKEVHLLEVLVNPECITDESLATMRVGLPPDCEIRYPVAADLKIW